MQIDYLVDVNLIGKRIKKASDKDIYRLNHNKVVTKRYKVYEE
jgi:hypothetical protein